MKRLGLTAAVALGTSGAAMAGGVERTTQSVGVLFEEGRYLEFTFSGASPSVSGVDITGGATTGGFSGDIAESYLNFGAAYKADLNDTWSYAIIYDQPYGADVLYPAAAYFATGSSAELNSHALTGILQYNMPNNVSLYGGIRAQTLEAEANVPFLAGYSATGEQDFKFGYLVGIAYEKPEIALRVALTYLSAITHDLTTTESFSATPTITEIETPQAVNLEFQSGIAEDTLLFGSVRWADWTEFNIAPPAFQGTFGPTASLVSFRDDRTTFTLGLGRRLNETWSVAGSVAYEENTGSLTGNLGPTDGFLRVGLGATYTKDNMKITGGVTYIDIGNATTALGAGTGGSFTGNHAMAAGVKVGWSF